MNISFCDDAVKRCPNLKVTFDFCDRFQSRFRGFRAFPRTLKTCAVGINRLLRDFEIVASNDAGRSGSAFKSLIRAFVR
jgi:hypothetical protein